MRTIIVRAFAVSLVTLWFVVSAAAQGAAPADLLTSDQVQELVARANTPADHLRLARHFTALAERYDANAKRHTAMTRMYGRNPNRRARTASPLHCKQLTDLASESASVVRELAAHHVRLAAGTASMPPLSGTPFERGAGAADLLSDEQAQELAATARTAAEHAQLQKHFSTLAAQYTTVADWHTRMARRYTANPNRRTHAGAARHCQRLARLARESATAANALAAEHEDIARAAGTNESRR